MEVCLRIEFFMSYSRKINQLRKKATATAVRKTQYCLTKDCVNKVISSCHVISKKSQLAFIADENKNVAWINPPIGEVLFKKNRSVWRTDHYNNVLVFRGFCGSCDNNLFKEIDNLISINAKNIALLNFRSFCYIYWWDRVHVETQKILAQEQGYSLTSTSPIFAAKNHLIRNLKEENDYLEKTNNIVKEDLLGYVLDVEANKYRTIVFEVTEDPMMRFSCAIPLTVDIFNSPVLIDRRTSFELPRYYWHLLSVNGNTKLIISWDEKFSEFAEKQVELLMALSESKRSRVLFQLFSLNNKGFACNPNVSIKARSQGFEEIDQYLRNFQEKNSEANFLGIPTDKLETPNIFLGEGTYV